MSIWAKIYNRINWRNYPSTDTALNESNLNKMDYAINELDNRILELHGYEERAEQFSIESENFSKDSKSYADESKEFSENSLSHANTSLDHANTSLDHANESEGFSKLSESFAHGNTGVREGENIDNSYYYYNKAKEIAEGLGGGLLPLGTIAFEDLPQLSDVANGGMYNISNDFVTTEDFKEGAGLSYAKGTNVYKTVDGKWDCLSGNNVIGVKGDAEEDYRRGNVNITAENIGLGNVNNTSDADKPVSTATNNAIKNAKKEVANNLGGSSGWSADTSYNVGDYCIYSNTLYRCKVANVGQNPPSEDYWELVSIASLNDNLAHSRQLLWSNPNPNVAFSSNINLSSNDYDELEVVYYLSSTITNTKFTEVFEKGSQIFITKTTSNSNQSPTVRQRIMSRVDDTHYETVANGCVVQQTNSTNRSVDYASLVPIEIYGIKHYSH